LQVFAQLNETAYWTSSFDTVLDENAKFIGGQRITDEFGAIARMAFDMF
jgi:hypothetical protein